VLQFTDQAPDAERLIVIVGSLTNARDPPNVRARQSRG
jgi:hypothetical protein